MKLISVAIVAVIIVGGLVWWSRSSTSGTVTIRRPATLDAAALGKTLDGTNFSLKYPNSYAKRVLPAKDNDIELYELRANTVYDKRLAVEITHLPTAVLTDDGSYNFRKVHPEDYQERLLNTQAGDAHIMIKSDGKEQTAFMIHNGKLATLAFVTDGAADQLTSEVDQVVASVRWKS